MAAWQFGHKEQKPADRIGPSCEGCEPRPFLFPGLLGIL